MFMHVCMYVYIHICVCLFVYCNIYVGVKSYIPSAFAFHFLLHVCSICFHMCSMSGHSIKSVFVCMRVCVCVCMCVCESVCVSVFYYHYDIFENVSIM